MTFKNGLPFNGKLPDELDNLKKRINENKASLIIVDGEIGMGKTTLAVEVADYHQVNEINLKTQLGMGGEDFMRKLRDALDDKKLNVIVYDEAGDYAKRGFQSKLNKMLNRIFDTFRTFKILIILVLPMFVKLDKELFDKGIPRLLIHIKERNDKWGKFGIYGAYRMSWLSYHMGNPKLINKKIAYNYVRPNSWGYFHNLSLKRARQLDKISTESKIGIFDDQMVIVDGLILTKDIARELGISISYCRNLIKRFECKPKRIVKNKKYYDKKVLNKLRHRKET